MKKLYSIFAALVFAVAVNAQSTKSITITNASITNGGGVLGSNNYNGGAERTWDQDNISFGGKAITNNPAGNPTGSIAGAYIQAQANNGVIYNTVALPGRIVSVTLNQGGTAQVCSLYGSESARLVNSATGNYNVTGGTQIGTASSEGWTSTDLAGTNYTYFAIKRGALAAYFSSIVIVYEDSALSVGDINTLSANFVKNTLVDNNINFAAKADVKIVNMNGQVVRTASVSENAPLNVADLTKGTYIVTAIVNGKAVSEKIIKK